MRACVRQGALIGGHGLRSKRLSAFLEPSLVGFGAQHATRRTKPAEDGVTSTNAREYPPKEIATVAAAAAPPINTRADDDSDAVQHERDQAEDEFELHAE